MGALICSEYIQTHPGPEHPSAIFLNAPPVGFSGFLGKVIRHSPQKIISKLAQISLSVKIEGLVDLNYLSHDPTVKEKYRADPGNHLQLHTKLLLEMVNSSRRIFSRSLRPRCPAFVTVGSADKVICVESLVKYFTSVEKDFHLEVFEGAYHELHYEVKRYQLPYFDFLQNSLLKYL